MENDLDQRQRNVVVNAYEAKHAGSIEEGSEGEKEKRAQVAADLGEILWYILLYCSDFFLFLTLMVMNDAKLGLCRDAMPQGGRRRRCRGVAALAWRRKTSSSRDCRFVCFLFLSCARCALKAHAHNNDSSRSTTPPLHTAFCRNRRSLPPAHDRQSPPRIVEDRDRGQEASVEILTNIGWVLFELSRESCTRKRSCPPSFLQTW